MTIRRVASLLALATVACAAAPAADEPTLETDDEKVLYTMGLELSRTVAPMRLSETELAVVSLGLADGVLGRPKKVDPAAFRAKMQQFAQARAASMGAENKKAGAAFLEKVAAAEGVRKTASGLLMKTISEGTGQAPGPADRVKVHYTGKLVDGTVFDNSVERGTPFERALNEVIPCWTEGLQLMKVGGKAMLYCPSDIAYGDRGRPGIPPGATLTFEVELLEILK